jgi:putative drug exporter of the RND superfamily
MRLERLTHWCYKHRWTVLVTWIVALLAFSVIGKAAGGALDKSFSGQNTESQRAYDLLKSRFPAQSGDTFDVVVHSTSGVRSPAVQAQTQKLLQDLSHTQHVTGVRSFTDPAAAQQVSKDGTIGYATVQLDVRTDKVSKTLSQHWADTAKAASGHGVQYELGGWPIEQGQQGSGSTPTELIGVLAAIVILLIAFGSLLATGLPILTALSGIGIGLAIVELLAHVMKVPVFAPQVASMIGIGVGIDYALFILTRYRQGLAKGKDPEGAVLEAANTAGRAVLFAGTIVVISLLGMFLMRFSFLNGLALGASAAVAMVMLASITLLPATLGFAGRNIDKFSIPFLHRKEGDHRQTMAWRWSREIQRYPWAAALVSVAVLIVLALPLFSMHLGNADAGNDLPSQTTRKAYDLLAKGFGPGYNGPLVVAVDLSAPGSQRVLVPLHDDLAKVPGVVFVTPPQMNPKGDAAIVNVIPATSPQSVTTEKLVHHLRDDVIPVAVKGTGAKVDVGGATAIGIDVSNTIGRRLPYFIAAVIALSFVLLMCVFRSVVVAFKAAIMNLLSIGAAYGLVVAVFQWGWAKSLFGVEKGPVESWVPMMLFAVLFGLSMDYEVFLISRIREEWLRTGNNAESVADGLAATARVITAAAAIMIAVFLSFVLQDLRVLKMVGFGLAAAVFIDATIVRMVLVPATMELLGNANWWLPRWLDRALPRVNVEGEHAAEVEAAVRAEDREELPVG